MEGYTVMMAPCSGFYADPASGKKQVRLAYVLEQDLLQKAVECLRVALERYPGSSISSTSVRQAIR